MVTKDFIKKYLGILQFIKFSLIGGLNTLIDFGVLNLLMWLTRTYQGLLILLFNTISFTTAVINSYCWNKYWTFQEKEKRGIPVQFFKFLIVSIIGAIINGGIVFAITTFIPPIFGLSRELWANLAKAVATAAGLIWNFIGYKFWAFKITGTK
jgi:putative flippase GtrA